MATSTTKKERDYWRGATNWLIENDHEDKYFCPDELTSEFFLRLLDDADSCAELEQRVVNLEKLNLALTKAHTTVTGILVDAQELLVK